MKKITTYLSILLLLVGLITSCSSSPEYGKMIPKDALYVMSLNVQDAVESSELGDATLLKEQLDKSLAHAKMPQASREQLKEIMEDPRKSGFDFREPILLFAAGSFPGKVGLIGAVSNQDDLEDFLEMMQKEGVCAPVLETEGLRYTKQGDVVFAFNDKWFFLTERAEEQANDNEVLDEIRKLAAQPVEESLQDNEAFIEMQGNDGFMHMLYLGKGIDLLAEELHMTEEDKQHLLPEGLEVEDLGLVCDFDIKKGEMDLSYKVLPLSDRAEEWLDKNASEVYGNLEGTLVNYIPEDALFYGYANVHGAEIFKQMQAYPGFVEALQVEPGLAKTVENVASSFSGDVAFLLGKSFTASIPEFSIYAVTKNDSWLQIVAAFAEEEGIKKIDDRTYVMDIPDPQYRAYDQAANGSVEVPVVAKAVFGMKKGISYILLGKTERMLESVDNPITVNKDYTGYLRLNAEQLLNMDIVKSQLGPIAILPFKKVVGLFDYAECYAKDGREGTFRIVMKNKDQSPVKTIYDEVEKILQILG